MWDETVHPFIHFNGGTFEVQEWIKIASHTLLGMWLFIHAAI